MADIPEKNIWQNFAHVSMIAGHHLVQDDCQLCGAPRTIHQSKKDRNIGGKTDGRNIAKT